MWEARRLLALRKGVVDYGVLKRRSKHAGGAGVNERRRSEAYFLILILIFWEIRWGVFEDIATL